MRRRQIKEGDWLERVWGNYPGVNTFALSQLEIVGAYGIPSLKRCDVVPEDLHPWDEKSKWKAGALHFYCEDAYLSGIWKSAAKYPVPAAIKKAGCCLTPDYSVYTDWPKALCIWNVYRARLLGALWQSHGIKVIPSLMWGATFQFDYLFEGLPTGGSFAISTGQTKNDEDVFKSFYTEALARCSPDIMLIYGQGLKPWIEDQGILVKRYDSRLTQVYLQRRSSQR